MDTLEIAPGARIAVAVSGGADSLYSLLSLKERGLDVVALHALFLPEELRPRVALSPHIGGATAGTFIRSFERIKKNIEAVANGQRPECVVNGL